MPVSRSEIDGFHQFVLKELDGGTECELEDYLKVWREHLEYTETVEDVRQGLSDYEQGLAEPLSKSFEDIRSKLRLEE